MKNFNQKGLKNPTVKEKRYSKSIFKSKAKTENNVKEKEDIKDENSLKPKKVRKREVITKKAADYRSKYEENARKSELTFTTPNNTRVVILTKPTQRAKGFSVLSKGQCVTVEGEMQGANLWKVRTMDSRIGVAQFRNTKDLNELI